MDRLNDLLEQLAAKLGVAVDVLWSALIRQALFAGIGDLIFIAAIIAAVYFLVKLAKWIIKERVDEIAWMPFGLVAIAVAGSAVFSIVNLPMLFAEFFNPKYWAIKEILDHIK